ncbi:hypothetical protein Sjap_015299 [Stephania japonica]|uniref:UmuC domain-containing protein n=1 Tax=Stephania japonica TaxID=461633 RepID=A0AAP0IJ49_9MAGN
MYGENAQPSFLFVDISRVDLDTCDEDESYSSKAAKKRASKEKEAIEALMSRNLNVGASINNNENNKKKKRNKKKNKNKKEQEEREVEQEDQQDEQQKRKKRGPTKLPSLAEKEKERFIIPDKASHEKHILQRIGRLFGAWKSRHTKELENGNDEKPATIDEKLWKEFKKQRRSSNFREQSNKAKEIRAKQTIQHTTSRKGYARLEYEMEKKDGASVSRAEVWIRGHSDKNGKPHNAEIAKIVVKPAQKPPWVPSAMLMRFFKFSVWFKELTKQTIAEELKKCVYRETGLTCSAGVAPNRLLAKAIGAVFALATVSIPTMNAFRRLATSMDEFSKVASEEVPGTLSSLKLSGLEINDLTQQLSKIRQKISGSRNGMNGQKNMSKGKRRNPNMRSSHIDHMILKIGWKLLACMTKALLYRLSGDYNPLHSDPAFAGVAGYFHENVLLMFLLLLRATFYLLQLLVNRHNIVFAPNTAWLCTLGFAVRAIIKRLCNGEPTMVKSIFGRFLLHVYPGETLIMEMWIEGSSFLLTLVVDKAVELRNELASRNPENGALASWSGDPCLPLQWEGLQCEPISDKSFIIDSIFRAVKMVKICRIGGGYVGAYYVCDCAQVPIDRGGGCRHFVPRIAAWNSEQLPIYELGLDDVVKHCRGKNLFFKDNDVEKHVAKFDIIFVYFLME